MEEKLKMIDCKKRVLVSEQEYDMLIKKIGIILPEERIIRYFFDNEDFTESKNGTSYQIKYSNGSYIKTIQSKDPKYEDYISEKNMHLDCFDTNAFKEYGVRIRGIMDTKRFEISADKYCRTYLDMNIYEDTVDYELEINYLEGYEDLAICVLESVAKKLADTDINIDEKMFLSRIGKCKCKFERFFDQKMKRMGI